MTVLGKPAMAGPAVPYRKGYSRMDNTEQDLKKAIVEDTPHHFISAQSAAKAVAVGETESLFSDSCNHITVAYYRNAKTFKIAVTPDVVIAREKVNFNARIN